MEIATTLIKKIAEELETGMLVFYNFKTGELVSYPNEMGNPPIEAAEWKQEIKKVKKDSKNFFKFEPMDAMQSINLMKDFVKEIDNVPIREEFEELFNNRQTFQRFKQLIQAHPKIQQLWYAYKTEGYINWVHQKKSFFKFKS